jgi:hypothetical protein
MDHHLHGLAHGEKTEAWCFGKDLTCYYGFWWRKGLFRQGSPLRRMIFLITPPRRGEGGGGGEPGLKGYVFWSGAEEAFTRALFSFVWMTSFSFVNSFLCRHDVSDQRSLQREQRNVYRF